jgi:hypothetical protein
MAQPNKLEEQMKRIMITLALLLTASAVSAQKISSSISSQNVRLIDSLVTFIGTAPAEVRMGSGVLQDGSLRPTNEGWVITLSIKTTRTRFALLHEFGHFLNAVRGDVFYAYLDSLNLNDQFDRDPRKIWELFADDFAWAWEGQHNGWAESFRPGVNYLRRQLWPVTVTAVSKEATP